MGLPIVGQSGPSHHQRLLSEAARHSIPLDVSIELTHHCNFRCKHCYIPDFSAPDQLDTGRVLDLLAELQELGTLFLTLTGGELFLRRDWHEIASAARDRGFALRLFSNGALIDESVADRIRPLQATVEISLYAMEASVFDDITRRPGSFEKTLRGVELLRSREVPVVLKTPLMPQNLDQLPALRDFAAEIGADLQASPTIMAKKNGDTAPLALRVPIEELGMFYGGPSSGCHVDSGGEDPRIDGPQCAAASRYCNITSSGDVLACNILPGSAGNIRQRPFREIWEDSPWLNEVRSIRRHDLHTCKSCEQVSWCGRCHAQALVEDGDLYGPSSYAQERAEWIVSRREQG